jgi:hypothetical protein
VDLFYVTIAGYDSSCLDTVDTADLLLEGEQVHGCPEYRSIAQPVVHN